MQAGILNALAKGSRRISVRSGHGVGKTTTLAWSVIWWICTRFPQKTRCTAPTSGQLFDALVPEIKKWMSKLPPMLAQNFEVQAERIIFKPAPAESFVSFMTSRADAPEAMAGLHAENVLIIGDEASGIPEAVFQAGVGSMSGASSHTILAGNPTRGSGYFYDTFHALSPDWVNFHVSSLNHPRVDQVGLVKPILSKYGERHNEYRVRVLGEFPLAQDDTVLAADLVRAALNRDVKAIDVKEIWGVDVARGGADASALARRKGNVLVRAVETKYIRDTMAVTGWIKAEWDKTLPSQRPSDIVVDVIGVGAGVVDRLLELGLPVRGINVSETPAIFSDRYLNQRAELWFKGLDWFTARDCSIGDDKELFAELIQQTYKHTSSGKLQVTSKESMKNDGIASPNRADAFLLTLAVDAVTAMGTAKYKTSWRTKLSRALPGIA